jgi:hypothetical protein
MRGGDVIIASPKKEKKIGGIWRARAVEGGDEQVRGDRAREDRAGEARKILYGTNGQSPPT